MNQLSSIGFGTDITVMAGYAQAAGAKLGNIDFVFHNTGNNTATIRLMTYDGTSSPSGFAAVSTGTQVAGLPTGSFTVVAGGQITKSYVLLNQRVAFFGSGNTTVGITSVIRNKSDLRGAQIDIIATGRRGWKYDDAFNKAELAKKWGEISSATGEIGAAGNADGSTSYNSGNTTV